MGTCRHRPFRRCSGSITLNLWCDLGSHLPFLAFSFLICKIQVLDEKDFSPIYPPPQALFISSAHWPAVGRVFLFPDGLC